jgi:hypothetical protein
MLTSSKNLFKFKDKAKQAVSSFLKNTLSNYFLKCSRQMTKFIKQTRASNKAKTRRKTKVNLLSWNKNWISVSVSSPRLSSSPQGLLLVVDLTDLFNGVATWKGTTQNQPMQVQRILGTKIFIV